MIKSHNVAEECVEIFEKAKRTQSGEVFNRAVPTGIQSLDQLLRGGGNVRGLRLGNFHVVAAQSSAGKSAFAKTIAMNAARAGLSVGVFTYEDSPEELAAKMLAEETGINANQILDYQFSEKENETVARAIDRLRDRRITIYTASYDIETLENEIREEHRAKGFSILVIDYIQKLTTQDRTSSPTYAIQHISGALHNLARETGICILLLAQLNRTPAEINGQSVRGLDRIRDSASLGHFSDTVILLDREKDKDGRWLENGLTRITVSKQKKGKSEVYTYARLDFNTLRFVDVDASAVELAKKAKKKVTNVLEESNEEQPTYDGN